MVLRDVHRRDAYSFAQGRSLLDELLVPIHPPRGFYPVSQSFPQGEQRGEFQTYFAYLRHMIVLVLFERLDCATA